MATYIDTRENRSDRTITVVNTEQLGQTQVIKPDKSHTTQGIGIPWDGKGRWIIALKAETVWTWERNSQIWWAGDYRGEEVFFDGNGGALVLRITEDGEVKLMRPGR